MTLYESIRISLFLLLIVWTIGTAVIAFRMKAHGRDTLIWSIFGFFVGSIFLGASDEFQSVIGPFFSDALVLAAFVAIAVSVVGVVRFQLRRSR
jgi:hypothetical protein